MVRGDQTLGTYFASRAKKTRGGDFELSLEKMVEDNTLQDTEARQHAMSVIGLEQKLCLEEEKKESKKDVIEEMEEPHTNTSKVSILRKRSTGSMTLNELRESLGLTKLRGEMDSNSEKKLQEELMTEISESTTRIRHIGSKYLALRDKL